MSTLIPSLVWSVFEGDLTLCLGALCVDVATVHACDNSVTLWDGRPTATTSRSSAAPAPKPSPSCGH